MGSWGQGVVVVGLLWEEEEEERRSKSIFRYNKTDYVNQKAYPKRVMLRIIGIGMK